MYFDGVPTHDQVRVPVNVLGVGVIVKVTAWPVLVVAVEPWIVMTPRSVTEPPLILPTVATVSPAPMVALADGSFWNFSAMLVRKPEAAKTSSETLARTV